MLDKEEIATVANEIRLQLNPHPAGQMELNVPTVKRWNQSCMECSTNTKRLVYSFQAKVKLVMHIVVFVLDGHSLSEWMK